MAKFHCGATAVLNYFWCIFVLIVLILSLKETLLNSQMVSRVQKVPRVFGNYLTSAAGAVAVNQLGVTTLCPTAIAPTPCKSFVFSLFRAKRITAIITKIPRSIYDCVSLLEWGYLYVT